ncbi:MAG TPA: type II toxin-antitoxin system VapB family antitoxin [Kribbellaceae bacterium]|jgi:antitoxin VapB
MSMNIKNQQTHDLARELASLTGETVTQAVTVAIRERLDRLRDEAGAEQRIADMHALAREIRELLPPDAFAVPHGDLLYDEMGLPK